MKATVAKLARASRAAAAATLAQIISALTWFFLLAGSGAALIVAGINALAGSGWAMVAAGIFLILAATFLRRGMNV